MIQRREFWMVLLLTIVTCGIYHYFYLYQMTKDINTMAGNAIPVEENGTTYLLWYLLGFVVCGLGIWVAMYLFIKNFNNLAFAFNSHMSHNVPPTSPAM